MSRLSPTVLEPLAKALSRAYRNPTELAALLIPLGQRFDDLTSQKESLLTNARDIVRVAQDQNWSGELWLALLKDRPNNADVRLLADQKPEIVEGPGISRQRSPVDRPSLVCNRSSQWNYVCQCAISRTHQAIIVPGCIGQATLHFRDRIESFLSTDPSRSIVTVHWPSPPPRALGELLERLAFALQVDVKNLEAEIANRLATRNLVVLHPCLSAGFRGAHFLEYYTRWWPAALGKTPTPYHIKCVQPVEWPINPLSSQPWWRRLLPDDEPVVETEARELIEHLTKESKGVRIVAVDELLNLERQDIDQFLQASEFDDEQRQYLSGLLTGGPQVPVVIFKTIDDYWREVSGIH
jgi:hypothetical protein